MESNESEQKGGQLSPKAITKITSPLGWDLNSAWQEQSISNSLYQ